MSLTSGSRRYRKRFGHKPLGPPLIPRLHEALAYEVDEGLLRLGEQTPAGIKTVTYAAALMREIHLTRK